MEGKREKALKKDGWPLDLLKAVFGENMPPLPDDIGEAVNHVLSTLREKEENILRLGYEEGKDLAEVGKIYMVTRERIRQIEANALRKLRHPRCAVILRLGLAGYEKKRQYEADTVEHQAQKEAECQTELNGLTTANKSAIMQFEKTHGRLSIEYLDLSIRAENALWRTGIGTVDKLVRLSEQELFNISNLGVKTIMEIRRQLNEHGLSLAEKKD